MRCTMISNSRGERNTLEPSTLSFVVHPSCGQAGRVPLSSLTFTCSFMHEKQKRCVQPSTTWILVMSVSSKQMAQLSLFSLLTLAARALAIWTVSESVANLFYDIADLVWLNKWDFTLIKLPSDWQNLIHHICQLLPWWTPNAKHLQMHRVYIRKIWSEEWIIMICQAHTG